MLLLKGTMFPQIGPSNGDKQTDNFSFGSLTSLTQEAPFRSMSKFSKWGYAFSTRAQVFQVRICQNLDCTFWEGWNRCPSLFSKYFLGRHGRWSFSGEAFGRFFFIFLLSLWWKNYKYEVWSLVESPVGRLWCLLAASCLVGGCRPTDIGQVQPQDLRWVWDLAAPQPPMH